jgi:FkbM family methyltransferase
VVHGHQNYDRYMMVIADCDLFLNPFPFGNTNGIVDTVWAGLMGVNKTGPEVNEHIDEGMFTRLGFPGWMTAKTSEEYKAAALRLIHDREERLALAAELAGPKAIQKLIFEGRPQVLGERIMALWKALPHGPAEAPGAMPTPTRTVRATGPAGVPEWLQKEVEDYFAVPLLVQPKVIIDIGANIGGFALRARREWPEAKVIAYEPLPSNVARLRRNVDPEWATVVPAAVRAESGSKPMYLGDLFVTGGFVKGDRQTINEIVVDCVAARDLPACDLLKIDTEGSEVEILRNMNLDGVDMILLEFHSGEDGRTLKAMLAPAFTCILDASEEHVGTLIFQRRAKAGAAARWALRSATAS